MSSGGSWRRTCARPVPSEGLAASEREGMKWQRYSTLTQQKLPSGSPSPLVTAAAAGPPAARLVTMRRARTSHPESFGDVGRQAREENYGWKFEGGTEMNRREERRREERRRDERSREERDVERREVERGGMWLGEEEGRRGEERTGRERLVAVEVV
eukprot:763967-Hanusia_phi.AAC.2